MLPCPNEHRVCSQQQKQPLGKSAAKARPILSTDEYGPDSNGGAVHVHAKEKTRHRVGQASH